MVRTSLQYQNEIMNAAWAEDYDLLAQLYNEYLEIYPEESREWLKLYLPSEEIEEWTSK